MKRSPRAQSGMTLLEVLVSILIFSFGILGLIALHARATQYSVDAEDRNRAALLANEIASEMLARQTLTLPAGTVQAWQDRVGDPRGDPALADPRGGGLSNGQGVITVNGNTADITITWRPPTRAVGQESRLTTQVVLPVIPGASAPPGGP
jgi:type IV pilus assembly protein PilV